MRSRLMGGKLIERETAVFNRTFLDRYLKFSIPLVGGLISINSIAEDIQVAHKTVDKWLKSLERLYAIFSILLFGPPKIKARRCRIN